MKALDQISGESWQLYHGDAVEVLQGIPSNSIDLSISSPPFATLYIYSDSERDLGNCADVEEFCRHYQFAIRELHRVLVPGRLCAIHVKDLPRYANVYGTTGLIDFPGACIQEFEDAGLVFHSRVTIWKCPVLERERTNNNGLLHKTVKRDTSQVRQGMADYLLVFRKPPTSGAGLMSAKPIVRPEGFQRYVGTWTDLSNCEHPSKFARKSGTQDRAVRLADGHGQRKQREHRSIAIWRRYAEPVWWDIDPTDVLNFKLATSDKDARHICVARDSLVLTYDGYVPIQDVEIGDRVLTHLGRWRPVTAKACMGTRPVVQVEAQGVPRLILTPDHKLWARSCSGPGRWPGMAPGVEASDHKRRARGNAPDWLPAGESLTHYVNLKLPPVEESPYSSDEWWIVGRWLGDGHFDTRGGVHISCSYAKKDALLARLGERAGFVADNPTAAQIRIHDRDGRLRGLLRHFGAGAAGKRLPGLALALDEVLSKALLDGYLSSDGHYVQRYKRWTASSVSRPLLLGMAMVAQRVHGVAASVYAGRPGGQAVIEGRTVQTRDDWILSIPPRNVSAMLLEDGAWKKVRQVTDAGQAEVWDISVAEDASFTAEGCIVKNCPLQLGLIERAVDIWSLPGEVVLSPFAGIGSEGVGALRRGRKFVGIELKAEYVEWACRFLREEEAKRRQPTLFDAHEGPLPADPAAYYVVDDDGED